MTIEFGAEIEVHGRRPKWLADDKLKIKGTYQPGCFECIDTTIAHPVLHWAWGDVTAIRLPADHFAYKAIAAGFEPWGGGDSAPDDWDGGLVLWREGATDDDDSDFSWGDEQGIHDPHSRRPWDIIGYRKKVAEQQQQPVTDNFHLEALQALQDATRRIVELRAVTTDPVLTIRINGPQGSGKTRWAETLRDLIPAMSKVAGLPVPVVIDAGEEG